MIPNREDIGTKKTLRDLLRDATEGHEALIEPLYYC